MNLTSPITAGPTTRLRTPTDKVLTTALLFAALMYLAADSTYAARGWDDATAGVLHVLAAIAYGFVILRIASWLPPASRLSTAILVTGLIGLAGDVAYGFDTIHHPSATSSLSTEAAPPTSSNPSDFSSRSPWPWSRSAFTNSATQDKGSSSSSPSSSG